jgi:hypothetical protein
VASACTCPSRFACAAVSAALAHAARSLDRDGAAPHVPHGLEQAAVRLPGLVLHAAHERLHAASTPARPRVRATTDIAYRADREIALGRVCAGARVLAAREGDDVGAGLAQAQRPRVRRDMQDLEVPVRVVKIWQLYARTVKGWVRDREQWTACRAQSRNGGTAGA